MFKEFMDANMLTTFGGIVTAVIVIVQFTKPLIKKRFKDSAIRIYTFFIALILTMIFHPEGLSLSSIMLTIINAIMITITSLGGYEVLSDPKANAVKR